MAIDPKTTCEVIVYGNHTGAGRGFQMTRNYSVVSASPPNPSDIWKQVAVEMAVNLADPDFLNAFPDGTTIVGVRVRSVGDGGFWPYGIGLNLSATGSSGDILPEGMGPLVQIYPPTPEVDRRGFTRLYWPLISEADQTDGKVKTTFATAISDAMLRMDDITITDVTFAPVVVSQKYDEAVFADRYTVMDKIAYIRRRYNTVQGQF